MIARGETKECLFSTVSCSSEETIDAGEKIATLISPGTIIRLFGELGAGKTTFMKGFASQTTGIDPRDVTSPTFTYFQQYHGQKSLYHFDLYRLKTMEEFLALGFAEYLDQGITCCIEWPQRINDLLQSNTVDVHIKYTNKQTRQIDLYQ